MQTSAGLYEELLEGKEKGVVRGYIKQTVRKDDPCILYRCFVIGGILHLGMETSFALEICLWGSSCNAGHGHVLVRGRSLRWESFRITAIAVRRDKVTPLCTLP